ncbi:FAD-binding oxidoreductase [Profundibacter amoris]|uniref:FAD-binding oxidoreductase n=1 Tax=Profundibacter amoris TaxID=2171755 RepID=A0A347UE13_9RHOB|nr:FAD-binding oxidoreductase [Profundibacter amoris]AXX97091.1 FAD-binding oxidoreductase [Profundibacter amoris]
MLNPADSAFETTLRGQLPEAVFRPLSAKYLEEPRGRYQGTAGVLVAPETVDQVASVIRACAAAQVGVVPYGGGTGLVGGQVLPEGPAPVILSLERMNSIRNIRPAENVLVAEAGAVLQDIQTTAEDVNRLFPLTLAAQGSCQIGGNLATNAGGVNVLRYGNARALCLGLEAVLPNGDIWHGLKRLRKDNTGYDLRDLLIGAEGTLGVITAASLRLFPRPAEEGAALMVVGSPADALELLALAQEHCGETVSAFELINGMGLQFLSETMPDIRLPFDDIPEWVVLVDLGVARGQSASDMLEGLFADAFERGLVSDGVIAQSAGQRADFWAVRETIPEANKRIGSIASHDIALPLSVIPEFIERGAQVLAKIGDFRINCFGHLGDGNLHYNMFPQMGCDRSEYDPLRGAIKDAVHDLVHDYDGSFSAEHGVGRMKVADLARYTDPAKLAAMRAVKAALDPAGIMNPGAVL